MGLLSLGTPLPWELSAAHSEHVRDNGLKQLVNMFNAAYERSDDKYLWGDEVEYILVKLDCVNHAAKISIDKDYILEDLNRDGESMFKLAVGSNVNFHPEYGRYMLEATPVRPYNGDDLADYEYVEKNMVLRRVIAKKALNDSSIKPLTITVFPHLGVGDFTFPSSTANGPASTSLFLPDEIINRHVRFPTLTANIRKRRGEKVAINVPMYQDTNTPKCDDSIPNRDLYPHDEEPFLGASKPGHIYMDSMGFGMGCSCLQVTVQAPSLNKSRYLYDSWVNFTPVFLALTAAAPVFKGFLAEQDVRWNVISGSVDDRTPFERNVAPLKEGNSYGGIRPEDQSKAQRIPKSRYDSVDSYLGDITTDFKATGKAVYKFFSPSLNDLSPPINTKVLNTLRENAMFDEPLARHFAHLYIRDPVVIFNERITQDNTNETDHFENIQSTNWQTLRFKPPTQAAVPSNKSVPGWRIEFRPMEIQITDFENAAFSIVTALFGQAILENEWNFYIPISYVEKNMKTAHKRDAVLNEKFWFKKDIEDKGFEVAELSIGEIINGCKEFKGVVPIIKAHLEKHYNITEKELSAGGAHERLFYYLELVSKRANGEILTNARFIRNFLTSHETYAHDSKVTTQMNYDLMEKITQLTDGKSAHELFGNQIGEYLSRVPKPVLDQ
ncbi:CYFA0S02e05644g1_1 [Cyberlindnera fabianii]|uniref:Glutamate--cysteine ligase n=1 Tax=Cyberlindnera fabianii TaxID=36022 RepID=A0A061AME7_CYBFA|nr:CYFA0S02e05644g1_1 [Cyberlindnera fabianii]